MRRCASIDALSRGLKEKLYQNALTTEMLAGGLSAPEEYHIEVYDGDVWLGRLYLDHWVNECVVVEGKAVAHPMGDDEIAQVVSYLAATGAKVGLLQNFGRSGLEYKRILAPTSVQGWQRRVARYLWRPDGQ